MTTIPIPQFQPECIWWWGGVSFREDMSMVRVRATDLDEGLKIEIKYAFAARSTHIQFGFDHNSGEMET